MPDETMQALMMTAIKELKLVNVSIPTIERPDDVLLKVKSVGICGSDLHGYTGQSGRRTPPLIMGHEVAAEVVAVGEAVTEVSPGDRVAIMPIINYKPERWVMGMNRPGAYAEYTTWPASHMMAMPDSLSYEAGALAEPLSIALHAVSLAPIRPYDTAFIVGAGPIGLLTLSLLKTTGVSQIAVSDASEARLDLARRLGAQILINPKQQNPRQAVNEFTHGNGVDIAFEAVGISATCQQTLEVTRNQGTIIWIGNNHRLIEIDMQEIVTRELKIIGSYGMTHEDFRRSLQMLNDGVIPVRSLINQRAELSEGPTLFDKLLASPDIIKCVFNFS